MVVICMSRHESAFRKVGQNQISFSYKSTKRICSQDSNMSWLFFLTLRCMLQTGKGRPSPPGTTLPLYDHSRDDGYGDNHTDSDTSSRHIARVGHQLREPVKTLVL